MASRKGAAVTQADLDAITKGLEVLGDTVDELIEDQRATSIKLAAVETKLETLINKAMSLSGTVSGDEGLLAKVAVLRSKIGAMEGMQAEESAQAKQIAVLQSRVDALQKHNDEQKTQRNNDRGHVVAQWSLLVAAAAMVITLVFQIPACQPRSLSTPPVSKKK